jgi:4-methylaminobutanoate oxidase (formaldehyde-forming)
MVLGNEPVFRGDQVVSRVTSGGIGYAVDRSIAFAYLAPALSEEGTELDVEVFGQRVAAEVVRRALWDPSGERVRT